MKMKAIWLLVSVALGTAAVMGIGYKAGKETRTGKKGGATINQSQLTNSGGESKGEVSEPKASGPSFSYSDKNGGKLKDNYFMLGLTFGSYSSYERLQINLRAISGGKTSIPKYKAAYSGNILFVRIYDTKDFNFDTGKNTYKYPSRVSGKSVVKKANVVDSGFENQMLVRFDLYKKSKFRAVEMPGPDLGIDFQK